jgi:hypothetical protein
MYDFFYRTHRIRGPNIDTVSRYATADYSTHFRVSQAEFEHQNLHLSAFYRSFFY